MTETRTHTGSFSTGSGIPKRRCVGCNVLIEDGETTFWCTVIGLGRYWKQGVGRVFHASCYIGALTSELEQVKQMDELIRNE